MMGIRRDPVDHLLINGRYVGFGESDHSRIGALARQVKVPERRLRPEPAFVLASVLPTTPLV